MIEQEVEGRQVRLENRGNICWMLEGMVVERDASGLKQGGIEIFPPGRAG